MSLFKQDVHYILQPFVVLWWGARASRAQRRPVDHICRRQSPPPVAKPKRLSLSLSARERQARVGRQLRRRLAHFLRRGGLVRLQAPAQHEQAQRLLLLPLQAWLGRSRPH